MFWWIMSIGPQLTSSPVNQVSRSLCCQHVRLFVNKALTTVFNPIPISNIHTYETRLASKHFFCIAKIRTNYGKFSIRYAGAIIWNKINDELKRSKRSAFKKLIIDQIFKTY